jgi:hypothetical protein
MTEAEESWAQIDKEFLALTWALERLDLFMYGQKVEVLTDHRPLLGLVSKPMAHCSIRQQRLLGRLMRYDIDLKFVPGKEMLLADTLSRAPVEPAVKQCTEGFMGTDIANNEVFVSECSTCDCVTEFAYTENTDRTREKILAAAEKCDEYRDTIKALYDGWNPADSIKCREYWTARDWIFESEGLLFSLKWSVYSSFRHEHTRRKLRGKKGARGGEGDRVVATSWGEANNRTPHIQIHKSSMISRGKHTRERTSLHSSK